MSESVSIGSQCVVFPDGIKPANLILKDSIIERIEPYQADKLDRDYKDLAILPGVIDPHVHINEPGRTHWEGWETGTKAALAGGVTTLVDMPLNCIPSTIDTKTAKVKAESCPGKLFCDVGFWGGAVPGNADDLQALVRMGALGLKSFMSDPGTDEFANLDESGLRAAMKKIAEVDSVLLLHAEWPAALVEADGSIDSQSYAAWLATRPVEAERQAIAKVVELSAETKCRCHIVHVASHEVLDVLEGTSITCETCAHYLAFCAEEIPNKATNFKCAPPIRERVHQEGLWRALAEGKINMVTSDHSPCPPDLKNDDFLKSWGGIAGVQMLLAATWTGASKRGHSLSDLVKWLSLEPSKLCGLEKEIGSIAIGKLANLVIFDQDTEFVCESLYHRHAGSPYEGRTWRGVVKETYLRGAQVYTDGAFREPQGTLIGNWS